MVDPQELTADQVDPTLQLAQVRVPLEHASLVFDSPDANGRMPIVVLPRRNLRLRFDFLAIAGALVLAGILTIVFGWSIWLTIGSFVGAVVMAVLGGMSAFFVRVPEGTNALLARAGRHVSVLGPGSHVVMPYFVVSHIVTRRQIPFDLPRLDAPTRDNISARLEALLTFVIADPVRFVYSIAAPDFDLVLQAACQDATRSLLRSLTWTTVLEIDDAQTEALRAQIQGYVEQYGVEVAHLNVTYARPAALFLRNEEARLEAEMRRRIMEIDTETQARRLARLEEMLVSYPRAADWEWQSEQLGVTRALADNSRAVVQLGRVGDIASSLFVREVVPPPNAQSATAAGTPADTNSAPRILDEK